ncbi:hypothetical protein Pan216_32410 [Planctomycetes bacterium Pan216]|uniref:Inositol oxygenase n=1 Tax=Kolteria novifilia TaxID=2527975 RepID=A0A518B5X4_9BACT|nr:hypothetical protein Pan216_32410 [Planctomycetes bacterium Pan216]
MVVQSDGAAWRKHHESLEQLRSLSTQGLHDRPGSSGAPPGNSSRRFRDYGVAASPSVRDFYRVHHQRQTLDFVLCKKRQYATLDRRRLGIWESMVYLNQLVDTSDPDINLPQIQHLLQTAEAIRRDGHPRWFILTGLIHDLGKILCLFGEPQWAVVGDTYPVGCAFSDKIVFHEFLKANEDWGDERYRTRLGIYTEGCGLDHVHLTWGHDEYLYQVTKAFLPEPALFIIRYHSFQSLHREGAYEYLLSDRDKELLEYLHLFASYDLYTKSPDRVEVDEVRPYYEELIAEYFPPIVKW